MKYRNFRQAWLFMDEARQTLPNLTARLLDEEASLTSTEEQENAFLASSSRKKDARSTGKNEEKPNKKKMDMSKVACYNCRKKGHFARNCPSLKKTNEEQNENQRNNSAFNVECQEALFAAPQSDEDKWIMDSGASAHMTHHREFFWKFEETSKNDVALANKQELPIKGIGTIKIEKLIDGKWYESTITNVLYVPNLKRNLFSEGVLTKKGMKIIKEQDSAKVIDKKKIVAYAIRESNNLYAMLFRTIVNPEANVVSRGDLKLWHEHLGHVNVKSLREMIKKNLVEGVKMSDVNNFFCKGCQYGKQYKLPFSSTERRKTVPTYLL